MWKHIRGVDSEKPRKRKISTNEKGAHTFSLDCSRAHRGMFAGILVIVVGIISLIMFYVLSNEPQYHNLATLEVTVAEMILYIVTTAGVGLAFMKMRDLKFSKPKGIPLDCLLLLLAQSGVYIYSMFRFVNYNSHAQLNGIGLRFSSGRFTVTASSDVISPFITSQTMTTAVSKGYLLNYSHCYKHHVKRFLYLMPGTGEQELHIKTASSRAERQ